MVLSGPSTGVEGSPGYVGDQVGDCARKHVLRIESLGQLHPHVETALGDVPVAHRQELLQRFHHGVAPSPVHGLEVHDLLFPVELVQVHGDRELADRRRAQNGRL